MFIYNLSDTEYLLFHTRENNFEVFSGHEGTSESKKIAVYSGGKWVFEDFNQKQLFFILFTLYKNQFGKALKAYQRSLREKPALYEFTCIRRRVSIKVAKLKQGWSNWFVGLYPYNK